MNVHPSRGARIAGWVLLAGVLLLVWHFPLASTRGRIAAEFDIHRGQYEILTYGLAGPTRGAYASLLRQQYGIHVHAVAGCVVSQSLIRYVTAYDEVSEAAIKRKFGSRVLDAASTEAEADWKRQVADGKIY